MLINDFFSLKEVKHSNHTIEAVVSFDETHSIFGGHFEDFPVVPGVCMMQLIKEIMEQELHRSFRLSSATSMKFMTVKCRPILSMVSMAKVPLILKLNCIRGKQPFLN
jgi:3-hydroxyacyl-[acyl-carrier-protein] dehydratase